MSWIHVVILVPIALLLAALVHDFLGSLSEERVWADPAIEDSWRSEV
jgi:uncharacterized membrane protein